MRVSFVQRINKSHFYFLCAVVVFICILAIRTPYPRIIFEDVSFFIAPSAEKAYAYGAYHFDAREAHAYDLNRSERFFYQAKNLNSQLPLVEHQLARIAFLRGDFFAALQRVDRELAREKPAAPSYYLRGLIKGYMEDYDGAARDYKKYIESDPTNWAATNDLAWVYLKGNRPQDALDAINVIIDGWPKNPWLLNSKAIALFELGRLAEAYESAKAAETEVAKLSEQSWSTAYPGNDPLIAAQGLAAFKKAVRDNVHSIEVALQQPQKDVQ